MSLIDLGIGRPNTRDLPLQELGVASARVFARGESEFLQYGPDAGSEFLRTSLAKFLSVQYGNPIEAQHRMITYGASHGIDLILSRYTSPGDTILVEDPTYFFALDIFCGRGVNWLQGPVDLNCEDLRRDARDLGVDFRPGTYFSCQRSFRNCLRIYCTYFSEQDTEIALLRLCRLLKQSV